MSILGALFQKKVPFSLSLWFLLLGLIFISLLPSEIAVAEEIVPGVWKGVLILREVTQEQSSPKLPSYSMDQQSMSFSFEFYLRILSKDRGLLVDIPEQGLYSYPIDEYTIDAQQISFIFDAIEGDEELRFLGNYSTSFLPPGSTHRGAIVGSVRGRSWNGSFYVQKQDSSADPGQIYLDIPVEGGALPATLVFPLRVLPSLDPNSPPDFPLILLVAGAGRADRDGNNVDVPGKIDSLRQLSNMLRMRNVGTLRYDKRGTGEAYKLEKPGRMTSFSEHVRDLTSVIIAAAALPRNGRLIVAGMNEGAWIAMAALEDEKVASLVDGFVVIDASGQSPMETLKQSVASLDEELRAKALEAAHNLVQRGVLIDVPAELIDFFAPSRKDWLATWLAFDPVETIARVRIPILFIYGENDLQISREEFSMFVEARPEAAVRVVPEMNYVLKEVKNEDENFAAFTDPSFKVPSLLADLLASFAKVQPAPEGFIPWH
ncbi:MAG: Alpha/beta hydrolase family protein [Spirochaetes bacterium ADurb.Bin110]|nr:MAG: Alpha/beta hydrolase family protein [Spirochaetes bacterium ADurb.Bin110]